ncbi:MAG TPA: hypothetical protein VKZ53_16890 [Candidatus Angelobacter sp.]|nr:hypothetical protein [Candidatus Angelobacter sp.]
MPKQRQRELHDPGKSPRLKVSEAAKPLEAKPGILRDAFNDNGRLFVS